MKLATKASAGVASSSAAAPSWRIRPVDDHADPVGERGRVLEVVRDDQRRQPQLGEQLGELAANDAARCARRAPRAARRAAARRVARERAGERDALPLAAGEIAGAGARRGARSGSARAARPPARGRRRRRCGGRRGAGRARTPGRRARPSAARAAGRRAASLSNQVPPPSATLPRSGRSSPAIARSTLDFPAPDGPTSASVSRPSSSATERRKERRGWSRSRLERVHRGHQLDGEEDGGADDDELGADRERDVEVDVELLVDRERECLRDALERAGEHDRRAELADARGRTRAPSRAPRPPAASGSATRKKVRAGPAPSVRAAPVSDGSTASKAEMAARR